MKKHIAVISVALMFLFTSIAYGASTGYVGKKVNSQLDVKVNGKVIGQAVVIDGKSFIPVRDISNEIGASIAIDKGVSINLSVTETDEVKENDAVELVRRKIEIYKKEIISLEKQAAEAKEKYEADGREESSSKLLYNILVDSIDEMKDKISVLEETLKEIQ